MNNNIFTCPNCGKTWQFEDYELILMPYPHFECPDCGCWLVAF